MKTLLNKLYAARAELRRHDLFMTNQYERLNKPVDQIHKNHLNINILCIRKLQTAEKQIIAYLKTQEQQKKTIDESIDQIKDILYLSNEPKTPVLFSYMKKDIKKGLRHPKQMFHEPLPPRSEDDLLKNSFPMRKLLNGQKIITSVLLSGEKDLKPELYLKTSQASQKLIMLNLKVGFFSLERIFIDSKCN